MTDLKLGEETHNKIVVGMYKWFSGDIDIHRVEEHLKKIEQEEIEPVNIFSGGVYIRQLNIPIGTLIIGKRHRHATCNILMSGVLLLYSGGGEPPQIIEGPLVFESEPGTKKMAFAITNAVFMNLHPTSKTDVDEIEKEFIITEEEYTLKGEELK